MEYSATGIYKGKLDIEKISDKLSKRIFQIDTGEKFNPVMVFDLLKVGNTDNLNALESFSPGDQITVWFNIDCKESKKQPLKFFTNLVAWKIRPANTEPPPTVDNGNQHQHHETSRGFK